MTAAGLRERLGITEMGGKTGTTQNNTDAWFMGYTPQLLAGVWIGCDDNFIRLDGGLGQGTCCASDMGIFLAKHPRIKILVSNKKARFVQPENMKSDMMYDYMNIIDKTPPPGKAEGDNQGNGDAGQYLDTSSPHVPVDSKLSSDEQKVLNEANGNSKKTDLRKIRKNSRKMKRKRKADFLSVLLWQGK